MTVQTLMVNWLAEAGKELYKIQTVKKLENKTKHEARYCALVSLSQGIVPAIPAHLWKHIRGWKFEGFCRHDQDPDDLQDDGDLIE